MTCAVTLAKGDVILEVNGKEIPTSDELVTTISSFKPGEKVKLKILRRGDEKTVTVELAERPVEGGTVPAPEKKEEEKKLEEIGLNIRNLSQDLCRMYRIPSEIKRGVVVTYVKPTGSAAEAGLREGDVITEFNLEKVDDVDDIHDMLRETKKRVVPVYVVRGSTKRYVALKLE